MRCGINSTDNALSVARKDGPNFTIYAKLIVKA
jgi:hypothetical protein